MIKRIDVTEIMNSSILGGNWIYPTVLDKSGNIKEVLIKGNIGTNDYIDCILDSKDNFIYVGTPLKLAIQGVKTQSERLNIYKTALSKAIGGRYIILKSVGDDIEINVYKIKDVTIQERRGGFISLDIMSVTNCTLSTLKLLDKEDTQYELLANILKIKMEGMESFAKDLPQIVYTDEADYAECLLNLNIGNVSINKEDKIYISNSKRVIANDIISIDNKIVGMVDVREIYSMITYKGDGKLALSYPSYEKDIIGDADIIIECEKDSIARDCMKRFVQACQK